MKIRKAIKVALTGATFALPAAVALANGPAPTNFTVDTSDNITASTGAGLTCSGTAGSEAGFLQRECTDGTNTYIQTVIAETGTEGLFRDSNVVMTGGNNGIADITTIDSSSIDGFNTSSQIQEGAVGAQNLLNNGGLATKLDQTLNSVSTGETMNATFGLTEDAAGNLTISLGQTLDNTNPDEQISQSFDHYELNALQSGSTTNGVTFAAGDFLANSIINQDVNGVGLFSLQDFGNENTGGETGVDSLVSSAPHYTVTYSDNSVVFP